MESAPLLLVPSLLLPWEVIERIISHCDCDSKWWLNPKLILNFSLICRELRPRSLCLLVSHPVLSSSNKVFDFCDFLRGKPHLKPLVHSISVNPKDFAPVPLLRIVPNLSEIRFMVPPTREKIRFTVSSAFAERSFKPTVLNQSSLKSCQLLSGRIQTLCLSMLSFTTCLQLLRVLSAFERIERLVFSNVVINAEGEQAPLDVARQRLSQRLRLLTAVRSFSLRFLE